MKETTDEEDKARLFVAVSSVLNASMLESGNELEEPVDPTYLIPVVTK